MTTRQQRLAARVAELKANGNVTENVKWNWFCNKIEKAINIVDDAVLEVQAQASVMNSRLDAKLMDNMAKK